MDKALQDKLDLYEQIYFSLDKPVPIKGDLKCYPVKVKDYYTFYSCLNCLTMDKTIKYVPDEMGRMKKVSNPEGIGQSYLEYLIKTMQDQQVGPAITQQVMELFELIFHIKKGMYCPECKHENTYADMMKGYEEFITNRTKEIVEQLKNQIKEETGEEQEVPKEILQKIQLKAQQDFFIEKSKCPECGQEMREIFSIKSENGLNSFMIYDTQLGSMEIDELRALVPRQNILDYDGDKYMDPDLKEELELKAKLQNSDYTSPTLEKQLVCVSVDTGFTFEYLQDITIRKLSMMLRTIDKKHTYYAQLQASMSGMVTFKEDPKHWIFSDDKKNIAKELTSLEDFEKKFDKVT